MIVVDIEIRNLEEASWNVNHMDDTMLKHLKESLKAYGNVQPLVVRPLENSHFEVLSGNQRFRAIREMGYVSAPCIIVELDDSHAMLLAQALNQIRGQDNPALKVNLLKKLLSTIPQEKILSLLPETEGSLRDLSSLGQGDLAEHLQAWSRTQVARLKHLQLQLTDEQLETIQEAIRLILPKLYTMKFNNPNQRSNAIYLICKLYLKRSEKNETH